MGKTKQLNYQCVDGVGISLGTIVGILLGYLFVIIISSDKKLKVLLYSAESKSKSGKCKIQNQKYTCKKISLAID